MLKYRWITMFLLFAAYFRAGAQTNFGPVAIGSSSTQTVTITLNAATTFTAIRVVTMGATGLDYNPSGTGTCAVKVNYDAGQTCTIGVTFKPLFAGQRMGAVVLSNTSTDQFNIVYLQGIGEGPEFAVSPGVGVASDPELNGKALIDPTVVAIDGTGTTYIVDIPLAGLDVIKVTASGTVGTVHPGGGISFESVSAVAVDGAGNRIISGRSVQLNSGYAISLPVGASVGQGYGGIFLGNYDSAAVDGAGDVFLLDSSYGEIVEYPTTPANAEPIFSTPQANGLSFNEAHGLAVDLYGNVYTADTGNSRVVEIPAGGGAAIAITPVVNTLPVGPTSVAVDGVGNLYIADPYNLRIVEVPVGGGSAIAIQPVVNGVPVEPSSLDFDLEGNLFITDNSATPRIVEIERSQASVSFAKDLVGKKSTVSPQTVVVQNVGTAALNIAGPIYPVDFPEDAAATSPCTNSTLLSTGQICTLAIDFDPMSSGYKTEQLELNDPLYTYASAKVNLSGTATNVLLSAYNLDYGSQQTQTESASQQVTLTNGSNSALAIHGIQVTGAYASSFIFSSTCPSSLPSGQSCIIHGHFDPTAAGNLTAALTITDSESDSPQTITLTGTGVTPPVALLSATSLNFGTIQTTVMSTSQYVTLTNSGGAPLRIFGIRTTGPDASSFIFEFDCPSVLTPGSSCSLHGHFTPQTTGTLMAAISITDSASGPPQQISLAGIGSNTPATTFSITPALQFGNQVVGRSGPSQGAVLTNTGQGNLVIQSSQLIGQDTAAFRDDLRCTGVTLAPGASCSVFAHFDPTALGAQSASLVFSANLAPPPTISLTGMGVSPAQATYSAMQIKFGSIPVGETSASQSITLTNTGGAPMHQFNFYIDGTNAASFIFGQTCVFPLAVGASCTIHGHFTPTTTGPLMATLEIVDDAGPQAEAYTQTIILTGTGQ